MKSALLIVSLLASVGSAWLGAKIRTSKVPLSGAGSGTFAYARPLTVNNASGGALSNFQTAVSTDVYSKTFDTADASLKALWHLDETSGTAAADSSGTSAPGTLYNSPVWSGGRLGSALTFAAASSQYVDVGSLSTFSFIQNTGIFTIETWLKFTNYATVPQYIMGNTPTSGEKGFYFGLETGRVLNVVLTRGTGVVINSSTSVAPIGDNNWHHVAVTGNGSTVTFYVDGNAYAGTNTMGTKSSGDSTHTLHLGHLNYTTPTGYPFSFSGQLDEVRIYNRALSAQEIADHAGAVYGLNAGLVGSWHFSEGTGTNSADGSGNLLNAAMNVASWSTGQYGSAFTGTGASYLSVPDSGTSPLDLSSTGSIDAWIKLDATPGSFGVVANKRSSGAVSGFSYELDLSATGRNLRGLVSNGTSYNVITGGTTLQSNVWYHVTFTWSGSQLNLYLNGVADAAPVAQTVNAFANNFAFEIGRGNDTTPYYFRGQIDELRLYSRALAVAEIAELGSTTPKLRPDLQDLRFTSGIDGMSELPYWLESDKKAWVKVPSVPAGTSTFTMFYGNPSATFSSASGCASAPFPGSGYANCGASAMDFFDDFETYALGYDLGSGSPWNKNSNAADFSLVVATINNSKSLRYTPHSVTVSHSFVNSSPRWAAGAVVVEWDHTPHLVAGENEYIRVYTEFGYTTLMPLNSLWQYNNGAWVSTGLAAVADKKVHLLYMFSSGSYSFCIDQRCFSGIAYNGASTTRRFYVSDFNGYAEQLNMDNVRVRRYATPEPWSWAGAEAASGF